MVGHREPQKVFVECPVFNKLFLNTTQQNTTTATTTTKHGKNLEQEFASPLLPTGRKMEEDKHDARACSRHNE